MAGLYMAGRSAGDGAMPYRKNARILAEIYLQHIAARRDFFFPGMRLTDAGPLMITGACVLLSTLKSRPLTRADIGRRLGVPDSTTLRHLRALIKHGWVQKQGHLYVFAHERANTPEFEQYIKSTCRLFKAAVEQLTTADQKMPAV
jgi:DNA-binding MarR family transcriptional regulator